MKDYDGSRRRSTSGSSTFVRGRPASSSIAVRSASANLGGRPRPRNHLDVDAIGIRDGPTRIPAPPRSKHRSRVRDVEARPHARAGVTCADCHMPSIPLRSRSLGAQPHVARPARVECPRITTRRSAATCRPVSSRSRTGTGRFARMRWRPGRTSRPRRRRPRGAPIGPARRRICSGARSYLDFVERKIPRVQRRRRLRAPASP